MTRISFSGKLTKFAFLGFLLIRQGTNLGKWFVPVAEDNRLARLYKLRIAGEVRFRLIDINSGHVRFNVIMYEVESIAVFELLCLRALLET